jgi:hypothetical protein
MFPGRLVRFARVNPEFRGRGFYQTTTIGPAGRYCWLDYVGGAEGDGDVEVGSG